MKMLKRIVLHAMYALCSLTRHANGCAIINEGWGERILRWCLSEVDTTLPPNVGAALIETNGAVSYWSNDGEWTQVGSTAPMHVRVTTTRGDK